MRFSRRPDKISGLLFHRKCSTYEVEHFWLGYKNQGIDRLALHSVQLPPVAHFWVFYIPPPYTGRDFMTTTVLRTYLSTPKYENIKKSHTRSTLQEIRRILTEKIAEEAQGTEMFETELINSSEADGSAIRPFGTDLADSASDRTALEGTRATINHITRRQKELESALARLDRQPKTFGVCQRDGCGKLIPKERLFCMPEAVFHVDCKRGV